MISYKIIICKCKRLQQTFLGMTNRLEGKKGSACLRENSSESNRIRWVVVTIEITADRIAARYLSAP